MLGCNDYWLSLGGDVIARGVDDAGKPWRIGVELHAGDEMLERFISSEQATRTAVATSSRMRRKGEGWHHIIDPRSGRPAETPIEQVTVVADTGVAADVQAKCLLIAGDTAAEYWANHRQITAYVQYHEAWERLR